MRRRNLKAAKQQNRLKDKMFRELDKRRERYHALQKSVSDPKVIANPLEYQKLAKELSGLKDIVSKYEEYTRCDNDFRDLQEETGKAGHDAEFLKMAHEELEILKKHRDNLSKELEDMLLVGEGELDKNIIMEIRAGTGGVEAGLFAADLFRMYTKYAAKQNWKVETMDASYTEKKGVKEIIFSVQGKNVYSKLKFESGTHRVQRVPETEASGRVHTSAVTVAVLPEAEEIDVQIKPEDLKIDVFRAGGRGGQHVNVTDSAVRITHMPTGLVVSCQDERSQHKNKVKAMRVLRARFLDKMTQERQAKISKERKMQVGTGDRSEKIRTYNFPDGRVTDHRIGLTLYKIQDVMEGELDELMGALKEAEKKNKLAGRK